MCDCRQPRNRRRRNCASTVKPPRLQGEAKMPDRSEAFGLLPCPTSRQKSKTDAGCRPRGRGRSIASFRGSNGLMRRVRLRPVVLGARTDQAGSRHAWLARLAQCGHRAANRGTRHSGIREQGHSSSVAIPPRMKKLDTSSILSCHARDELRQDHPLQPAPLSGVVRARQR